MDFIIKYGDQGLLGDLHKDMREIKVNYVAVGERACPSEETASTKALKFRGFLKLKCHCYRVLC